MFLVVFCHVFFDLKSGNNLCTFVCGPGDCLRRSNSGWKWRKQLESVTCCCIKTKCRNNEKGGLMLFWCREVYFVDLWVKKIWFVNGASNWCKLLSFPHAELDEVLAPWWIRVETMVLNCIEVKFINIKKCCAMYLLSFQAYTNRICAIDASYLLSLL